jgi:excisionase family DNA binding protein
MVNNEVLLSQSQVAERLGISVQTVERLRQAGRLGTVRVTPRRVMIRESSVTAYLESLQVEDKGGMK